MATPPVAVDVIDFADAKSGGLTHEELLDQIAALDTDARPLTDVCGSGSTENIKVEYAEEELAAANPNNVAYDGQRDFDNSAVLGLRYANFIQHSEKMISVGDIANKSNNVGSGTTLAKQVTNRLRELRNDKEARFTSSIAAVPGTSGSAGSECSGFGAMIRTGRLNGVGGADGVLSDPDGGYIVTAPVIGTKRALTMSLIDEAIMGSYSRGGRVRYAISRPEVIKGINDFLMGGTANIAALQTDVSQSQRQGVTDGDGLASGGVAAISAINVLVTAFGTVTLVPDYQMPYDVDAVVVESDKVSSLLLVDPDWVDDVNMGDNYNIEAQGKVGLATDRLLTNNYTLRLPSERAHAVIGGIDSQVAVTQ